MVSKKKNPYSYEDGIEKSVHRDHRLSSLENPRILMNGWTDRWMVCFVCFVALRPKSTAMVMGGRSVHLTTLFPGQT